MKQRLRRSARGLRCNNERRARFEGAKAYIRHAKGVHQHRKLCREGQFFPPLRVRQPPKPRRPYVK